MKKNLQPLDLGYNPMILLQNDKNGERYPG